MHLTIEKVAFLRRLDIFSGTPDYILAAVAQIMEEVDLPPDETFIESGTIESCLYIIAEGQVRVHHNDQTIIMLNAGESVGELAVLDPNPRSASASTTTQTLLYRLEKEPFDEVMADRPEIALGVIRALAKRIREQGQLIANQS